MSIQRSFPHRRYTHAVAAVLLAAGSAAAADATAPDAATSDAATPAPASATAGALTQPQALVLACARNETTAQVQARIDQAQGLLKEANSLLRPSVTGNANYTVTSYKPGIWTDRPQRVAGAEADIDFTFFNLSALPAIRGAKKTIAQVRLQGSETRRALSFAVASAYIQVIAAEHTHDAAVKSREVAQHSLNDEQARADAGLASANDATRARLTVAQADTTLIQTAQAETDARLALAVLIAAPADGPVADPPDAVAPSGDANTLGNAAIVTRQDLAADALQIDIDHLHTQQLRYEYLPTLAVRGSFSTQDQLGASTPLDIPRAWSLGLVATWSLYDGGLRDAQAEEYEAQARGDSATLRLAKRTLHHDLAQAMDAVRNADALIIQTRIEVTVAETNANENHARVVQGLGTALEEADANAALFSAEVDLSNAQLDGQSSRFALRQIIGLWPLDDREPTPPAQVVVPEDAGLDGGAAVAATAPGGMSQVVSATDAAAANPPPVPATAPAPAK